MLNYGKKYKLSKKENASQRDGTVRSVHRVIALRDIPLHGVKAGDKGGYVESKMNLFQEGDAWIGGNAFVTGNVRVKDNALVTDDAIVNGIREDTYSWIGHNATVKDMAIISGSFIVNGNSVVQDRAVLKNSSVQDDSIVKGDAQSNSSTFRGKSTLSGSAQILNAAVIDTAVVTDDSYMNKGVISGSSFLGGNARVENAKIRDNTHISGNVKVKENSICEGNTRLSGSLIIPPNHYIFNKTMEGKTESFFGTVGSETSISEVGNSPITIKGENTITEKASNVDFRKIVSDIEQEYKTYSADIVKLIKYPVMADPSVPQTQEFLFTLRQAKRFTGDEDAQRELAEKLERSFMIAEANALKVSSSAYSDEERKRATDAKQFINKACDETSSIVEKKNSFRATMKALEGVVALPEEAIDAYRVKIGLLEIEA